MHHPLDINTDGGVSVWTIDLPDVGNAITGADLVAAFEDAVDAANADTDVRAVILTGAGHIFSAGGNVREMADEEGLFGLGG
ncbi:enoyl-CoA hydratase, partial [Streptomyces sp. SID10244]|nr:enoyl-CoA hydratase [Streptomyces sp. SID10244]